MNWLQWLRRGKAVAGRGTYDVLFALAFTVFMVGGTAVVWGALVSDASAVPGFGIVATVVGAYGSWVFGWQDRHEEQRSVVRSLGRGYKRMGHWVRPPKS